MEVIFKNLQSSLKYFPILIIIAISLLLYFYGSPQYVVDQVGIKNAYILMFSFALLGGLTTFNTVPYYSLLFLLATTGIDPLYLGLSSAFGVMCGDSFSYLLGRQGGTVIPERFQNFFGKVKNLAEKHEKVFLFFCFLYGSISPLSNDFISLSAGMARIKYWKVMLPLGLGNIVFNVSFAYLCVYGGGWVGKIIS